MKRIIRFLEWLGILKKFEPKDWKEKFNQGKIPRQPNWKTEWVRWKAWRDMKYAERLQKRGLKYFSVNGSMILALNQSNAERKFKLYYEDSGNTVQEFMGKS
jgi:hypothetical protein